MIIRRSTLADMGRILEIYAGARDFMAKSGNPSQWVDGHPRQEVIEADINIQRSYICVLNDEIVAVFYYGVYEEPNYFVISDGNWLNDAPYGVIHRIAVAEGSKGVGSFCLKWCFEQCGNLRIDTHHDNTPMRNALIKLGYSECGIIYVENDEQRVAYQKSN